MERLRFLVYGRVQGVGFRWAARDKAEALGLVGYARNLPDGQQVEIIVEGPPDALQEFRSWCYSGPDVAMVRKVHVYEGKAEGIFSDFSIY